MISYLLDGVEYRPFDHLYAVSHCGRFLRKGVPSCPKQRQDGYLHIGRRQLAHRLVAAVWCERPEGANHVHHINHIKTDNRAENLQWVSPKQHMGECHADTAGRHTMPESAKARLRQFRTGMKHTEETKRKIGDAILRLGIKPPRPQAGYSHPESAKARMRLNSPNATPCVVFGVRYSSVHAASEVLGIKRPTLRKRCLSKNFPEYQLERKKSQRLG